MRSSNDLTTSLDSVPQTLLALVPPNPSERGNRAPYLPASNMGLNESLSTKMLLHPEPPFKNP